MSVIKFLCPNGHPLSAPDKLIGKRGKCPKCDAEFLVPSPQDAPYAEETPSPAPAAEANPESRDSNGVSSVVSGSKIGSASPSSSGSGSFVFLCPNGHKLNGSFSLRGQLGQCPHCGARFQIPDVEPEGEPELETSPDDMELPPADEDDVMEVPAEELEIEETEPPLEDGPNPLAQILARLWRSTGDGTGDRGGGEVEVEISLQSGDPLTAVGFSPVLSQKEFAVFALKEGTGFAIKIVPWNTIRGVALKNVSELPPAAFRLR